VSLPITPSHEVAGVEEVGDSVPQGILDKGDLVLDGDAVFVFIRGVA
jgi:hypothetical protein